MKKIIGILGVGVFALTVFANTNTSNEFGANLDLANLITISSANAECPDGTGGICRLTTSGSESCLAWNKNTDCD